MDGGTEAAAAPAVPPPLWDLRSVTAWLIICKSSHVATIERADVISGKRCHHIRIISIVITCPVEVQCTSYTCCLIPFWHFAARALPFHPLFKQASQTSINMLAWPYTAHTNSIG